MWVSERIQTTPTINRVTPTSSHAASPTSRSQPRNREDAPQLGGVDLDLPVLGHHTTVLSL